MVFLEAYIQKTVFLVGKYSFENEENRYMDPKTWVFVKTREIDIGVLKTGVFIKTRRIDIWILKIGSNFIYIFLYIYIYTHGTRTHAHAHACNTFLENLFSQNL